MEYSELVVDDWPETQQHHFLLITEFSLPSILVNTLLDRCYLFLISSGNIFPQPLVWEQSRVENDAKCNYFYIN